MEQKKTIKLKKSLLIIEGVLLVIVLVWYMSSYVENSKRIIKEYILEPHYIIEEYTNNKYDYVQIYQKEDELVIYADSLHTFSQNDDDKYVLNVNQKITEEDISVTWYGVMRGELEKNSDETGSVLVKIKKDNKVIFEGKHNFLGDQRFKDPVE